MKDDDEIGRWFDDETEAESDSLNEVLGKARSANSQRDTMDLVFVKIWAAMAVLLAPLFANLGKQQANALSGGQAKQKGASQDASDITQTNPERGASTPNAHDSETRSFNGEQPSC